MKKLLLNCYLVLSISLLTTAASYATWAHSCPDFWDAWGRIPEGSSGVGSYSGMCAGDGIQFVGVFVYALLFSFLFLGISHLVLKLLGFEITKKK